MFTTSNRDSMLVTLRFVKCLGDTLHFRQANLSKAIREVIIWEWVHREFTGQAQQPPTGIMIEMSDGSTL